jgi:hypothetical protein
MVVKRANTHINGSKYPSEAAINDPAMIPDNDKGKVRSLAALIQTLALDK